METYLRLTKPQQDELKDVGGFVAGALSGPRRKGSAVAGRDVITLDFDNISAGGTDAILQALSGLGCGYCVYSTHKHHAAAPRLRILFPLDRAATADEYEPCARRMATYIGIQYADPSTFEACRLMYWPSCSADSEYIYQYADSPLLSVGGLLATYVDWRDMGEWPQVPGAAVRVPRLAAKQGDPTTKPGIVGAFCRTYDIYAAMNKFLPGIYDPTDTPNRYTFTGGSTTGGAIVYDDGKFLFSHHATDPCGGRLVNAFDLVRLHKFDEKDDAPDIKPDTPVNRLPSFTAMCELAVADSAVSGLLLKERWESATEGFSGTAEAATVDDEWRSQLKVDSQGSPIKCMFNLQLVLEHDPRLIGKLRLNLFSGRIDITGHMPWRRPETSKAWGDDDAAQLRIWLEPLLGKVTKIDLLDAVAACAGDQAYHPVRDYLGDLTWDGIPRLDTLFIDYLGAADTLYIRAVTRKAFTAAVARVMRPGVKYDTMLVLIGGQGRYKSSILSKMGGVWFSDSLRTFGDKDAMETIQGTWINEVAEMQAMSKADVDAVKAFLTKTNDYYRAAYGHYKAVIATVVKYTDNYGRASGTAARVTATNDKVFLLAEFEVFGQQYYANTTEQTKQIRYGYYHVGNSTLQYKHTDLTTEVNRYSRSVRGTVSNQQWVSATNDYYGNGPRSDLKNANVSLGLLPAFSVGTA